MAKPTKKELEELALQEAEAKAPASVNKDIMRAIASAKMSLKKKFGDDLFSEKKIEPLPSVSTGSALLDKELGNGGWALGRVHELYGQSGGGKSSVVTLTCVNAIKQYPDKYVIYIDYEQAMNFEYAQKLGLDVEDERFIFIQSNSAEEGFETIEKLVETGGVSVVIIDSIPAMMTKMELEKGYDEMTMGAKAKFLSTSIPKMLDLLKKTNTALIFVNQVRDSLSYGGGSTTPGGKAVPFYSSSRVEIKRTQVLTNKEVPYGQTVKFFIRKNKVGLPFGTVETDLLFGIGFDYHLETVNIAIDLGIIRKAASWLKITHTGKEELVLQGASNAADYYRNNPDDFEDLKRMIEIYENKKDIEDATKQAATVVVDEKFDEDGY